MKKILVLLPNNLGDVIMTLPVLEALKKKYPDSWVSFFVEDGFEGGLINYRYCDNIIRFDRKNIRNLIKADTWADGIELLREIIIKLQQEKFDQIINLSQIPYVSHLVSLLNNSNSIGQTFLREGNHSILGKWTAYLYAIPFARYYNSLHATDVYKRIADISNESVNTGITIQKEEKEKIRAYIACKKTGQNLPIAIFQPGAAYDSKRWPLENFVSLGKKIISDGFTIFVTGADSERNLAEGLHSQLGENCIPTSGELTFRESIALLSLSELCVTSDSAIMHAGASLSRKIFALFGPTNPVETGPYSSGNIVFSGRCKQRPCFCFECKSKLCMKSISPETVYSYIKGTPDLKASCDVYRTTFDEGVYRLLPIVQNGNPYYSETGSAVTRKSLENGISVNSILPEYEEIRASSVYFAKTVAEMRDHLNSYITSGSKDSIQKFESVRATLIDTGGINDFWAAMLNLHLNSVPLIDPMSGVRESAAACERIISQIEIALSK